MKRNRFIALACAVVIAGGITFAQTGGEPSAAALSVTSVPSGAMVSIDGRNAGITPLTGLTLRPGSHFVILALKGYLLVSDTIVCGNAGILRREYPLTLSSSVSITSDPSGGSVYVDNVFRGTAPLVVEGLTPGRSVVMVSERYYLSSVDTVVLSPGRIASLSVALRPRPAFLSINAPGADVALYMNSRIISYGTIADTLVLPGECTIAARQSSSGKEVSLGAVIPPDGRVVYDVQFDKMSSSPLVYSLLLPGLGQMKAGSPVIGAGLALAFCGSLGLAIGGQFDGMSHFDDYSQTRSSYNLAASNPEALSLHQRGQQQYDAGKSSFRLRNVGLACALAVYILSAVDASFFHNKVDVIHEREAESTPRLGAAGSAEKPGRGIQIRVIL